MHNCWLNKFIFWLAVFNILLKFFFSQLKLKNKFLRHVYLFIDIITKVYLTNLSQISYSSFWTEINISVEAAAPNSLNSVISTPTVSYNTLLVWYETTLCFKMWCSIWHCGVPITLLFGWLALPPVPYNTPLVWSDMHASLLIAI